MEAFKFDLMRFSDETLTNGNDYYTDFEEKFAVRILALAGNDHIDLFGSKNLTIDGGTGDDTIENNAETNGENFSINGGAGNDTIINYGNNSTIEGNIGADNIINYSDNSSINGNAGDDTISDCGGIHNTLDGGAGNDTIVTDGSHETLNGGDDDDYIRIFGGELPPNLNGNDRTDNGEYISANGGAGNDTINIIDGSYDTINGGAGDDMISGYTEVGASTVRGDDGNDRIEGVFYGSFIDGGNDADKITVSGSGNTILGGNGNDTIVVGAGGNLSIDGGAGDDNITYVGYCYSNVTISTGGGNDTVQVERTYRNLLIKTDAGNDVVKLNGTVGGYGNPEVTTVEGGAGNDIFYGAKNDSLGTVYHFKTDTGGGGSTIIHNVGNADTVSIDGSYEEINTNSNDLTLRIKATKHEITLKDAKNIGLTIKGTKEILPPEPPQPPDDPPAPAITSQEVIKRLTFELSNTTDVVGIKQLDRAVVYATGGYYSSAKEVIDDMVRTRSNYPAGTAGSILWMKEKAGIILDNEDTGAIIGSDAGGSRSLNAEDIIPEEGELEDFTGSSFTFNGVKFTLARWKNFASNKYEKISFEDLKTEDQRYMARAIKTWWAREGLNVIKETYGYSFSDSDSTVGEILIMFVNDPNDPSSQNSGFQSNWLQATSYPSYANGKTYTAAITVNLNYYNNFDTANDKNGVSPKGQIHADRCYSHELLHAIMSSVVDYYHNLSAYLKEGLCEVLHGGDFRANSSMIPLANDTDKLRAALNSSSSYAVVDGVHSPSYGGGILFSRFLGKQGSEHYGEQRISYGEEADYSDYINLSGSTLTLKDGFKGSNIDLADYANITRVDATKLKKEIEIIGSSSSNVLQSGEGSDTIHTNNGNNTVSSGAGNDVVYAEGKKTVANLGEGNDTVYSGTGSATLTGGAGSDVFVHAMGDMVITDYNPGQDKIQLDRYSKIASATVVNGDVNFQVGQASILVKDSAGKKITVIDGEGISSTLIYNEDPVWKLSDTTATYGTSDNTLITLSGVKSLDGLSLNGKVVTVSNTSLDRKDVSISGTGYTLALGNDVAAPVETKAGWSAVDSGKATYNFVSTTAGYKLSNNKISYTKSVAAKSFTLTGIKSTGGITVNGSTVTLTTANLNKKAVTISDGFSIKLANDVSTSSTKTAGAFTKFKSSTATFKTSSFSDFYSLKNNKVTYTAQSGGKTISIKNLKSSATLDEIKSEISVAEQKNGTYKISFKSADVLTSKAPTISAADVTYTVALDKSLKPSALAPDWKISGTNASLKADTSAGYSVSDNKVLYSKKVTGSPQLVLGGLIKNSSLSSPVKKVVTLDSKVLGANSSLKSNAGSYTVKLTGNMSKKTFTGSANADSLNIAANNAAVLGGAGNDYFTVSGSKVTLTGGKGNDSFKLSGKNPVLIYAAGDDNDSVNFVAGMHISLSGSTQIKTLGKSGSDLLLGFGKNSSVKVTGAKSSDTIKVSDANGAVTLLADKFDLADRLTFNSKNSSVTVAKNFTGSLAPSDDIYLGGSKLSKVATINAGNVTSEISISGNAKANFISAGKNNDSILGGNGNDSIAGNAGNDKLYGQNGNDSLSGGKGNDSLWGGDGNDTLTGNDGNDFFIYESGKDVISDYTAGQDKIQIASGKISKTSLSSSDVLFTIGKGSLTVKNAKGKTISLLDSTGKASSTVVGAQALTNSNKASVTIGTDMGAVDASARSKAISITGNALANTISGGTKNDSIFGAAGNDSILGNAGNDKLYGDAGNDFIFGGKGNDSLWGGDGNDSLWGDAGKDTFIYTANEGTDKIFDYETGDLLKILNVDGSYGSFKSSKYSGGDLTLSINGSGKIIFEDVASSTKFNINGSSYNISGSKLVKK